VQVGAYELGERLGAGGMGEVLVGRKVGPSGFGRLVAIKRLHPNLAADPQALETFLAEGRLAAQIRHGKVVPTLDVIEGDEPLLVMDFVDGVSLAAVLGKLKATARTMPRAIASALVIDLLEGLHAAHALTVIHRDVSPQNLLVGRDGIARVIDFGIARAASIARTTLTGDIKGKLAYMPPEQLHGRDVTLSVDVYAAGAVLWECLTLRKFRAGGEEEKIAQLLVHDVDPPSRFAPDVPGAIDDVVLRALATAPAQRYPSALEMADAIGAVIPPASAREVARFVTELMADELARLAELTTRTSSVTTAAPMVADVDPTPATQVLPPRAAAPRRWPIVAGLAAVAVVLGLALASRHHAEPAAAASAPEPPPVASMIPADPVPTQLAGSTEPAVPESKAPARRGTKKTIAVTTAKPTAKDCAVPYELDENGLKHYKRECIKE
jgi:serine/threonine-protein kinase